MLFGDTGHHDQGSGACVGTTRKTCFQHGGFSKPVPGWARLGTFTGTTAREFGVPFLPPREFKRLCLLCLLTSHCPLEEGWRMELMAKG